MNRRSGRQLSGMLALMLILGLAEAGVALPPKDEVPEEVLRSRVITGARSPIDGEPLTATEYAELQRALRTPKNQPIQVSPKVRRIVNLLKLRRFLKTFFPFIPIR